MGQLVCRYVTAEIYFYQRDGLLHFVFPTAGLSDTVASS
jgi:hypothetical protein